LNYQENIDLKSVITHDISLTTKALNFTHLIMFY